MRRSSLGRCALGLAALCIAGAMSASPGGAASASPGGAASASPGGAASASPGGAASASPGGAASASPGGAASASLRVPEEAYGRAELRDGSALLEARLVVHPDDVSGSTSIRVGLLLDPAPGWHLYWRNPGQSGLAPELDWQVEGARVGPVTWPAPSRFWESEGELETFGYAGRVLLASEAELVADFDTRVARLEARILVCEHECVPTDFSLTRVLAPGGDPESAAEERRLFRHFARSVPLAPDELGVGIAAYAAGAEDGAALTVLPCAGSDAPEICQGLRAPREDPAFFPDVGRQVTGSRPHPADPRAWIVTLDGTSGDAGEARVAGVLALAEPDGTLHHVEVDLPLLASAAAVELGLFGSAAGPASGLLAVIGFALVGGLLLNLMPCVLPVLAIKVFGVAELASRSRRELRLHGLAYAAGVLLTMLLLASVVIALRWAGQAVGWGFQFQEPLFVAAISILLVVFASNLFGVFEVGSPGGGLAALGADSSGLRRSFFEGLLAVVLATPCMAPFLGTAVGFAFAAPPVSIAAIFAAIGLGLAAPYVGVTWVPGWARLVPRSGPWMLRVRAGLGFALLATVVWLVWIFGRGAGSDGAVALLALLLFVAFASWIYGMLQQGSVGWLRHALLAVAAAIVLAGAASVPAQDAPSSRPGAEAGWETYAAQALAARLARGQPAFVSFTADWCITCKLNERVVLADERVRSEWKRRDFALFRADWTQRDDAIRAELARFGRAGVPLYLVYHPSTPDRPILLPELLTVDRVLDALRTQG